MDIIVDAVTAAASRNLKNLTGDVDDLGDEVDRTNKKMGGLSKGFKTGLGVAAVAAAAGVAAATTMLVSSVRAGADAEEMLSKFNVVFGDTAGTAEKVTQEMDAFAKASGRNKYALREMASGFGDVLKPLGFSVTEAAGLSTEMSKLAVDLGSFNNMKPEQAFERLSSTLIGNHANALAFGVVINESVLKEELAAMGADELTGSLLEQAKVQARINLLIRGTTDAQGDAIRTSGSWTNQMLRLNAIMDETKTSIGLKLLPVLTPFLSMAGDLAEAYGPKLGAAIGGMIENIDAEKLKADIATFMDGLLTGTFVTPEIQFDMVWKEDPSVMFANGGETVFGKKKEISFFDIFDREKIVGDTSRGFTEIEILKIFGLEERSLTIDGVVVEEKLKIGDYLEGEWTQDGGLETLTIGGFEVASGGEIAWQKILGGEGSALTFDGNTITGLKIGDIEVTQATTLEDLLGGSIGGGGSAMTFDGNTITGIKLGEFEVVESMTWEDLLGGEGSPLTFDGNTITGLKLGKLEVTAATTLESLFGGEGSGLTFDGNILTGLKLGEIETPTLTPFIDQLRTDLDAVWAEMGPKIQESLAGTTIFGAGSIDVDAIKADLQSAIDAITLFGSGTNEESALMADKLKADIEALDIDWPEFNPTPAPFIEQLKQDIDAVWAEMGPKIQEGLAGTTIFGTGSIDTEALTAEIQAAIDKTTFFGSGTIDTEAVSADIQAWLDSLTFFGGSSVNTEEINEELSLIEWPKPTMMPFLEQLAADIEAVKAEIGTIEWPTPTMGPFIEQLKKDVKAVFESINIFGGSEEDGGGGPAWLIDWEWPEFPKWEWATYPTWTWPEFPKWTWPSKPSWWKFSNLSRPSWWKLSNLSAPGWVNTLIGLFGSRGGGGEEANATGTSFFGGGFTTVGEVGPELVALPRGSQVFPTGQSQQMAGAGMGGVTINVNATVANEFDANILAQQVAAIIRRRGA